MTDLELLELAAKAVGPEHIADRVSEPYTWNPLVDDGDALRLAVALRLDICTDDNDQSKNGDKQLSHVNVWPFHGGFGFSEDLNLDPFFATRRAIVRAAAKIGEEL